MFNDLPMEGGPCHLPAHPPPGWKERLRARSKIPEVLVNYAKQAPEVSIHALHSNPHFACPIEQLSRHLPLIDTLMPSISTSAWMAFMLTLLTGQDH